MNLVLGLPYFEYMNRVLGLPYFEVSPNECSINELSLRLPYFDSEA